MPRFLIAVISSAVGLIGEYSNSLLSLSRSASHACPELGAEEFEGLFGGVELCMLLREHEERKKPA